MITKNEKLLTIFLIFVCVYQLLLGVMMLVAPGKAYQFIILTNNPPGGLIEATAWWNSNLPYWWIYQRFNQFYVLSIIITLFWVNRKVKK